MLGPPAVSRHSLLDGDTTLSSKSSELAKAYLGGEAAPELVDFRLVRSPAREQVGCWSFDSKISGNKQYKN
jgi:hypothetical protein